MPLIKRRANRVKSVRHIYRLQSRIATQASTNLVKFVNLPHQTLDDYVTLFQGYEHVINPDKRRARTADEQRRFASKDRRIVVDKREHWSSGVLTARS